MTRPTGAMERLRKYELNFEGNYPYEREMDLEEVADYLLSRFPGERPEAARCDPGSLRFSITEQGGIREVRTTDEGETLGVYRLPVVYRTRREATLALIYQHWDAIDALVERLGVINKESEVVA